MNCIRLFLSCLILLTICQANADRTVNIAKAGSEITLSNPSSVPVNFNISCFHPNGNSAVNLSGEVLAPNTSKTYGSSVNPSLLSDASACTGAPAVGGGLNMNSASCGTVPPFKACPGSVTFANAASLCAAGTAPCEYNDVFQLSCASVNTFWMNPPAAGTLQFSTDSGSTFNNADLATNGVVLVDFDCTFQCKFSGSAANGCKILPKTQNHGAICCAGKVPNFCKVTITSTSADAFLVSPGFKGGAPF